MDISEDPVSPDWPSDYSTSPSLSPHRSPTLVVPATLPLRRRQRQFTTRDDRLRVRTLLEIGWSIRATARHLGLSKGQVAYASNKPPTPQKRSGRPLVLDQNTIEQIIEWICASKAHRRSRWDQIPRKLGLDIGYYAVGYALRKAGFSRRLARRKPPISERNRQARLIFALEHQEWTPEQWNSVL
jgi:transposase